MNKQDLINAIANANDNKGQSKAAIKWVLEKQAEIAHAELEKGGEVTLDGIGKLSVKTTAARKGRNPATGEELDIPAKKKPAFSAAKALKDAVAK